VSSSERAEDKDAGAVIASHNADAGAGADAGTGADGGAAGMTPDSSSADSSGHGASVPADAQQSGEPVVEVNKMAYLTFDDGPLRDVTPGILDVLARENIQATFFVVPYTGRDDLYRRIIDEGHEIGNHSYSHVYKTLYEGGVSAFREDVLAARKFIYDNFGYSTVSFRFPGGSMSQSSEVMEPRKEAIKDIGYRFFDWHVDPDDWRYGRTPEEIVRDVLEQIDGKEHAIILLHDMYNRTLEALPRIIEELRNLGYDFDMVKNYP